MGAHDTYASLVGKGLKDSFPDRNANTIDMRSLTIYSACAQQEEDKLYGIYGWYSVAGLWEKMRKYYMGQNKFLSCVVVCVQPSVLLEGQPSRWFGVVEGLRQGCPNYYRIVCIISPWCIISPPCSSISSKFMYGSIFINKLTTLTLFTADVRRSPIGL